MSSATTGDKQHVKDEIEQVAIDCIQTTLKEDVKLDSHIVGDRSHEWAYEADFYDILMLLDVVDSARDDPTVPSEKDGHWEQNDDSIHQWMDYIRHLGDTTMRHAVMDYLGDRRIGSFEPQDDFIFLRQ